MAALCENRKLSVSRLRLTVTNPEVNTQSRILDVPKTTQNVATASESATQRKPGPQARPLAERFWAKVQKTDSCWLWTGSQGNTYGHGSISVRRDDGTYAPAYAHRVAWELAHGAIPSHQQVLHNCPKGDNPRCVNPAHLFLGSQAENLKDAAAKGRLSVPRPNHHRRALTDDDVLEIRRLRAGGGLLAVIAERFGVTKSAICQIAKGIRRVYVVSRLRKAS